MENDTFQQFRRESEDLFNRYRESAPLQHPDAPRKSFPMIAPSSRLVNPMDRGHSREHRDWVVGELEKIFYTYGNPVRKGSVEMESQLYDKSRNQEEYVALAQRLLRHMRDLAKRRQTQPTPKDTESCSKKSPPSPLLSPSDSTTWNIDPSSPPVESPMFSISPPVESIPPTFPSVTSSRSATPSTRPAPQLSHSSTVTHPPRFAFPPADVHYGTVRLPAPNKRTFAAATSGTYRTNPSSRQAQLEQVPRLDDVPEIITRLVREDEEEQGGEEANPLSSDTYEVSFRFLVPRNAVIKQMTIHVKKTR